VGSGGKFAKLVNLFESGRFVEEDWEVFNYRGFTYNYYGAEVIYSNPIVSIQKKLLGLKSNNITWT
jgi:hypothetical protein